MLIFQFAVVFYWRETNINKSIKCPYKSHQIFSKSSYFARRSPRSGWAPWAFWICWMTLRVFNISVPWHGQYGPEWSRISWGILFSKWCWLAKMPILLGNVGIELGKGWVYPWNIKKVDWHQRKYIKMSDFNTDFGSKLHVSCKSWMVWKSKCVAATPRKVWRLPLC